MTYRLSKNYNIQVNTGGFIISDQGSFLKGHVSLSTVLDIIDSRFSGFTEFYEYNSMVYGVNHERLDYIAFDHKFFKYNLGSPINMSNSFTYISQDKASEVLNSLKIYLTGQLDYTSYSIVGTNHKLHVGDKYECIQEYGSRDRSLSQSKFKAMLLSNYVEGVSEVRYDSVSKASYLVNPDHVIRIKDKEYLCLPYIHVNPQSDYLDYKFYVSVIDNLINEIQHQK